MSGFPLMTLLGVLEAPGLSGIDQLLMEDLGQQSASKVSIPVVWPTQQTNVLCDF
jgi:hypothetical protein